MSSQSRSKGIAIVVVLLSAVVFLGIVVAITGTLSLSSRKTTSDQRVTLEAQYASESGLSRVLAEAQTATGLLGKWSTLITSLRLPLSTTSATLETYAKRFCNLADAAPANGIGINYCTAPEYSDPDDVVTNVASRYNVFTAFLSRGGTDPMGATNGYSAAGFTNTLTNDSDEEVFWKDIFSGGSLTGTTWGPAKYRYEGTLSASTGVNYRVSFGLIPSRVEIIGGVYSFVFRPRTSVASGQLSNTSGTQLSSRQITRSYTDEYRINMTPPSFAYYVSLTNAQTTTGTGGAVQNVFFNAATLFDGPVHTNGVFNFSGNPWFKDTLTSSGCAGGTTVTGTPPATTLICNGATTSGANVRATGSNATSFLNAQPSDGPPLFERWANGSATATGPELAKENAAPNALPTLPWNYKGKWGTPPIRLPVSADEVTRVETEAGIVPDPANPTGPSLKGIVFNTVGSSNTTVGGITDLERVELIATSTPWSSSQTSTAYATVANGGSSAVYQVIRVQYQKNISRCRVQPIAMSINAAATLNVGQNTNTSINLTPDDKTYAGAEAEDLAEWIYLDTYAQPRGVLRDSSSVSTLTNPRQTVNFRADRATSAGVPVVASATARFNSTLIKTRNFTINTPPTPPPPGPPGPPPPPPPAPTPMTLNSINVPANFSRLEGASAVAVNLTASVSGTTPAINVTYAVSGPTFVSSVPVGSAPAPAATSISGSTSNPSARTASFSVNIGTLPAGIQEATYQITVTPNGDASKKKTFTVTVKRDATNVELRPSARPRATMVQATPPCSYQVNTGVPLVYKWRFWREYVISDTGDMYLRDYPATGNAPNFDPRPTNPVLTTDSFGHDSSWRSAGNKFSGVFYSNVGIPDLQGPQRNNGTPLPAACTSDRNKPECSPPAIARFMKLTVSAKGKIVPKSDLKYEQPICTVAPNRDGVGNGQSNCPTPATPPAKNVLGLYAIGDSISVDTLGFANIGNTTPAIRPTLHAVMMSNTSVIEVQNVIPSVANRDAGKTCNDDKLVGSNAAYGNVEILGSVIQNNFGQFGRQDTTGQIACGYGRSMTYDKRMLDSANAPPAFPRAENSVDWNVQVQSNGAALNSIFSLQPSFTQNK